LFIISGILLIHYGPRRTPPSVCGPPLVWGRPFHTLPFSHTSSPLSRLSSDWALSPPPSARLSSYFPALPRSQGFSPPWAPRVPWASDPPSPPLACHDHGVPLPGDPPPPLFIGRERLSRGTPADVRHHSAGVSSPFRLWASLLWRSIPASFPPLTTKCTKASFFPDCFYPFPLPPSSRGETAPFFCSVQTCGPLLLSCPFFFFPSFPPGVPFNVQEKRIALFFHASFFVYEDKRLSLLRLRERDPAFHFPPLLPFSFLERKPDDSFRIRKDDRFLLASPFFFFFLPSSPRKY